MLKWDPGYGRVGIGAKVGGGDVRLWILRTPLKVKTNCRLKKFTSEVKIIHYILFIKVAK